MTSIEKGDYVVTTRGGSANTVRGYRRVAFIEGQELLVTSTRHGFVSVRADKDGPVFKLRSQDVRKPTRRLGEVPEGGIAADDPRVAWIFEDAGRLADRLGLCGEYDRLCDALGLPGRIRTFTVKIAAADGIEVTAKVEARSRSLAERRVREQFAPTRQLEAAVL